MRFHERPGSPSYTKGDLPHNTKEPPIRFQEVRRKRKATRGFFPPKKEVIMTGVETSIRDESEETTKQFHYRV